MSLEDKSFVIKRSEWTRGKVDYATKLYQLHNGPKRCCLGFLAETCGFQRCDLGIGYPSSLPYYNDDIAFLQRDSNAKVKMISGVDTVVVETQFTLVNDIANLSDQEREEKLTKMFALYGWTVVFED